MKESRTFKKKGREIPSAKWEWELKQKIQNLFNGCKHLEDASWNPIVNNRGADDTHM